MANNHFVWPAHVPEALRWDHSLASFTGHSDDPIAVLTQLFDGPDVVYAREISPHQQGWLITRHALQKEAFLDYEHFTSSAKSGLGQMLGVDWRLLPLESNPPEHALYRQVLNPYLTPQRIAELEAQTRANCDALIDQFAPRGECEFIEDFAIPFPTFIFLSLLGLPLDEAEQFLAWESGLLRGRSIEQRIECGLGVMHYLQAFIAQQKSSPSTELLEGIVSATIGERAISDDEILGLLYTLYLGGLDTVYSTLGWIMRHIARDTALQQQLRDDPSLHTRAVDEFIRLYGVVGTMRMVAKDASFNGVDMKAGDRVLLPLFLAGRDPEAWDDAASFRLDRGEASLSFASGPHVCVGRHLARLELRTALGAMLSRFSAISIAEGKDWAYHTAPVLGVDKLHLSLQVG
jgi:cytochrome P450